MPNELSDRGHEARRLQPRWPAAVRCHEGLSRSLTRGHDVFAMKTYLLKPHMAAATLTSLPVINKPASVPARQPLPRPVIAADKPMLKAGLDVHLEFIMAVVQRGHASPQAPRKFTREQLVAQIQRWSAEGLQVFCVQESC